MRQPTGGPDGEEHDVGHLAPRPSDRVDEEKGRAAGEADEAHDALAGQPERPADGLRFPGRQAPAVDSVREVRRAHAAGPHAFHEDGRGAEDEVAAGEIRVLDAGIEAQVEVIEDARHGDVERGQADGLVAQPVHEEVDPLVREDPADVAPEQPLIGREAA